MKQWHNDSNLEPNSVDAIASKNPLTHSGDDWPFKCQKKVKSDKSLIPTSVTLCWEIGGGEGGPTTEKISLQQMVWENIRVATNMFRYTQMLSMQYISRRINYRVSAMVYLQYSQLQNKCNGFVRRRVKVNSTLSKTIAFIPKLTVEEFSLP